MGDDKMKVKDLVMLLKQCDENKEIEVINEDYEDMIVLYPYDIEENDNYVDIMTANTEVDDEELRKETKGED